MVEIDQKNNNVKMESSKSNTILVVEDDVGLSRLIAKSLEKLDYNVAVVHNGADAVNWVVDKPIELILSDFKLPDMSANQLFKALEERKIKILFIIMTGHGDEKVAVEMMKAGARDYIVKLGGVL